MMVRITKLTTATIRRIVRTRKSLSMRPLWTSVMGMSGIISYHYVYVDDLRRREVFLPDTHRRRISHFNLQYRRLGLVR
jgi:hypothetical protein